jgi:hypothetical protein
MSDRRSSLTVRAWQDPASDGGCSEMRERRRRESPGASTCARYAPGMSRYVVVLGVFAIDQVACGRIGFDAPPGAAPLDAAPLDAAPLDAAPLDAGVACAPGFVDVLQNGGFEDPALAWTSEQIPADQPHSWFCPKALVPRVDGMYAGCVGLSDKTEQTLGQSVAMPAGKTVTLTGKICIATQETDPTTAYDVLTLDLRDGQTVIASLGTFTNRDGHASCDFVPFSQTAALTSTPAAATLRISAKLDVAKITTFYLDDLSLCVGDAP